MGKSKDLAMNKKPALLTILLPLLAVSILTAQKTTVFTDAQLAFKRGEYLFETGAFGAAMNEYKTAMELLQPASEQSWENVRIRSELGYAKSAIRLNLPDGEKLMLNFIRTYQPDPLASLALIEVANFFYNAKKYDKAVAFYQQINQQSLGAAQRTEVAFKLGYSYFVQKQFEQAEAAFRQIKDLEGDYFFPSNYYYGLCRFFSNQYPEAIKSFRLVERSREYKPHVPYYIAQIYFAQRNYDDLIKYAEPKLSDSSVRNPKELNQLVGQAYFEKGEYAKALPFLEKFAESSGRMREEEFYQLAFCQYKAGKYAAAARNFTELNQVNSSMGQMALYYLGDCELKSGNKQAARNAFASASRMSFDSGIQETSLLNYAKLSYELRFDKEALTALQSIRPSSPLYSDAQSLMSEIFLSTRNYEQAIATLEAMPSKTAKLKEAYQKVLYLRGLQLLRDDKKGESKSLLNKSVDNAVNNEFKAMALYWLGDISFQEKDYSKSIQYLNQFTSLAKNIGKLPDESSIHTANYLLGYNYLKKENFTTAQSYFQDAVMGIKRNRSSIRNKQVKDAVLGDATLRAGDCLFKKNQYREAVRLYDEALNAKYPGFEYALYQKAIIEGLQDNSTGKIIALEELISKYPNSGYSDNALYQLGITYQALRQPAKAIETFKKLIATYPSSPQVNDALLRLGLTAYNQGNTQAAISYYKQVFTHNPNKEEGDAALAALREIYLKDMGDPDGYNSFLETVPGYQLDNAARDENAFAAAESAYENGNYERAITAFSDYIAKYPKGINLLPARYHRAESYLALKQYTQALKDLEWVVEKGPGRFYVDAIGKAALVLYHNEKDFAKSYSYFQKWEQAAINDNDRFEAQLGAMQAAYRLGDASAVQTTARKVANNSAATDAQAALAHFYLGKVAFDRKEFDAALTAFNKVTTLSNDEQTAEARYLIAQIHYQRRDLDKAKKRCIDNNKENSDYPYWVGKSFLLLSDIFAEQDDLFSARTVLQALIDTYENTDDDIIPTAKQKLELLKKQEAGSSRLDRDNKFMDDDGNN